MKFIKNLSFDIRNGILKKLWLFLIPFLISCGVFIDAAGRIYRYQKREWFTITDISFGDFWFYLYGGMDKYIPSSDNPFQFPVVWIVVFVSVLFIVLNYPVKDLQGVGSQILVKTKGRSKWWLSKCCWNLMSTIIFHMIICIILLILCGLFGFSLNTKFSVELIKWLFNLNVETELIDKNRIPIVVFMLPVLVSMALNLIQMTLSLFVKPVFSFLAVSVILLFSAYLMTPFVPGNFAMPLRYSWLREGGVSYISGIGISLFLMLAAIVVGLIRFRKYDILDREEN